MKQAIEMRTSTVWGIQRKLTVSHMAASTLALLVACGTIVGWEYLRHRSELRNTIGIQAAIVGANSASALLFHHTKSASETLGPFAPSQESSKPLFSMPLERCSPGIAGPVYATWPIRLVRHRMASSFRPGE